MSFFQRIKNLAELSKTEPQKPLESEKVYKELPKEKKMAQIVSLDDPLEQFNPKENE